MKATKIYYKRLFNLGNYQNEEIGIELEVEDGEKAVDVINTAKEFINRLDPRDEQGRKYEEALIVLKDKENYSYGRVLECQKIVENYENTLREAEEYPF